MRAAVYGGTENVYKNMIAPMKSLLCNSNVEKIYFLIETDTFPYNLPPEVECINMNRVNKWFKKETCPNYNPRWSLMTLYRAAYAQIFPHLDKILSLDNDTIVTKDISELWDIDMTDYYLAGVRDVDWLNTKEYEIDGRPRYINGGVVLHNLKKIREDEKDIELIDLLNRKKFSFGEQDAFNKLFKYDILELPSRYNSATCFLDYDENDRAIIHYVGDPYYPNYTLTHQYRDNPIIRPWERT